MGQEAHEGGERERERGLSGMYTFSFPASVLCLSTLILFSDGQLAPNSFPSRFSCRERGLVGKRVINSIIRWPFAICVSHVLRQVC